MHSVSNYSFWVYVLLILISAGIAVWVYWNRPGNIFSFWQRVVLTVLRFGTFFLLGLILLSPLLLLDTDRKEKPKMLICLDRSLSVGKSLSQQQKQMIIDKSLEGIERLDDYEIDTLSFGKEVRQSLQGKYEDATTNMYALSTYISDRYYETNLKEILIISDGYINEGPKPFQNEYLLDVPVSVVAVGDTSTVPDFSVTLMQTPSTVLAGNDIIVDAEISCKNSVTQSAQIALKIDGRVVKTEQLSFQLSDDIIARQFAVSAPNSGTHTICLEVASAEKEYNLSNNQLCRQVDVHKEAIKVALCYESIHPDIAAISRSVSALKNIQIHKYRQVPNTLSEDVIIAHNINNGAMIKKILSTKKPVWVISGLYSNPKAWAASSSAYTDKAIPKENTPVMQSKFTYFDRQFMNENLLRSFPPLVSNGSSLEIAASHQDLIKSSSGASLMSFSTGAVPTATLNGEGIWRWRMYETRETKSAKMFDGLIGQTLLFLRPSARKNSMELKVNKARVAIGEPLVWSAQYYNSNLELDNRPSIDIVIQGQGSGFSRKYSMNKTKDAYMFSITNLPPGRYSYTATLRGDGVTRMRSGVVLVDNVDLEAAIPYADMSTLGEIMYRWDGSLYTLTDFQSWFDKLEAKKYKTVIKKDHSWKELIDISWLLGFLIFTLFFEWLFRKLWGTL